MANSQAPLKLLDVCDYIILARDIKYWAEPVSPIEYAVELYKQMDIEIDVIDTPFSVTKDELDFISSICGKNIQSPFEGDVNNMTDVTTRCLVDISKILDFYKVDKFWAKMRGVKSTNVSSGTITNPLPTTTTYASATASTLTSAHTPTPSSGSVPEAYNSYSLPFASSISRRSTSNEASIAMVGGIPFSTRSGKFSTQMLDNHDEYADMFACGKHNIAPYNMDSQLFETSLSSLGLEDSKKRCPAKLLYNTLFNMTILITKKCPSDEYITKFCNDYPEFELLESYIDMPEDIEKQAITFFHKQVFNSREEAIKKKEAFNGLFAVSKKSDDSRKKDTENEEVRYIVESSFDISKDPKERMKAIELYKHITSRLSIDTKNKYNTITLSQRISMHLQAMGLTKKRFTDGIYYYGVKAKVFNDVNDVTLEIYEKKRAEEALWFTKR